MLIEIYNYDELTLVDLINFEKKGLTSVMDGDSKTVTVTVEFYGGKNF